MVEFYLLTFPRFPVRKEEHKSYFGKNRTHDSCTTSRCAGYLLDHLGDERMDGESIAQKDAIEENSLHMIWEVSQVIAVSRRMHRYTRELRTRRE